MPRYFFDIHDGTLRIDEEGQDCVDLAQVRLEAMLALPEIANDEIARDGDKQVFAVIARDEDSRVVYTATLTFNGLWVYADPLPGS